MLGVQLQMMPRCPMLGLLTIGFLAPAAHPQSSATTPHQTPADDHSFYLNQPVDNPEAFSGVWEMSDGQGGAIGIHLELMTAVSGDADPPVWTPQLWQHLDVGVFQRKGSEIAALDENGFSDSLRGGGVLSKDRRIQLHFVSVWKDTPSVDLDLLRQPDNCWQGRFHRGSFDSVVTLCRPTPGPEGTAPSPLIGTWSSDHGSRCIHIFESGPGRLTGWSDMLEIPGQVSFGPNIQGPDQLYESYGDLAKIHLAGDGEIFLQFGAYSPLCCSHMFEGKLSADGTTLNGEFPPGPNQAPHLATFTKMHVDSCVDPSALSEERNQRN